MKKKQGIIVRRKTEYEKYMERIKKEALIVSILVAVVMFAIVLIVMLIFFNLLRG